jgi:CheY-like chemotaxis protein
MNDTRLAAEGAPTMFKVLIVDDSKLARMTIVKSLSGLHPDWTRLEAANGDQALAMMPRGGPDLAILDFNMPGRDGLVVAAELRALNPKMPLAVISANIQDEIVASARKIGAAFLAKPLKEEALAEFLAAAAALLKSGVA